MPKKIEDPETESQSKSQREAAQEAKAKLVIRNAVVKDARKIRNLARKVYPDQEPYALDMIIGQINNFPEGQFVAVYEDKLVGYCATFRINGDLALGNHSWNQITGGGYASRHDADGEYLYGMEVCVDPQYRKLRIGQRLYNERKNLCRHFRLKGIVFGGRMPGFSKRKARGLSPEDYIKAVEEKSVRDPVISFQLRNGFEILGVLKNYMPGDTQSKGHAVHMLWKNPEIRQEETKEKGEPGYSYKPSIRVGSVQYMQRRVESFEDFAKYVEYFVDVVSDYNSDFVVFPELFTLQLLSIEKRKLTPAESMEALTKYTERFKKLMNKLAVEYNINIIGGSHPSHDEHGDVVNICWVFLRDGSIHSQPKTHPTPNERYWWNITGGSTLRAIVTDCGPIGILICYDAEFPELARHLINQGAQILFVPFCTDERQSYLRVRYCAQARAVENQCYVVMSGNVGNLPNVENMDIQYGQSCILTPCDFPFARDGIAADTTPNVEMVAFADLDLGRLTAARNNGTVQNLKDRRFDLYHVSWNEKEAE
jgi:predicted amidohydrolase/GNAT superfamily N-acetyltransferase